MTHVLDQVVDQMTSFVYFLGVDGLDLVQREGCGTKNLQCGDQLAVRLIFSSIDNENNQSLQLLQIHLNILDRLRRNMPDFIIGYTFPIGSKALINNPFKDVIKLV